ncbi:MAG: ABC transporter ATP-binding protein [Segniliparus sp.]|uniref:ABC transporter ATP-binding protein n=1 Tax=Segniliparus sp. TaxID=2804064 RepID=UPI003F3EBF73
MSLEPPRACTAVLRLAGIVKRYPGVVANDAVALTVRAGEVHAICGENGAGKSTLMKILYGMVKPDEGTIEVHGEEVKFHSPAQAIEAGIGMVHQHFMLAENLTVLENVVLGAESRHGIGAKARSFLRALAEGSGLHVDVDAQVDELGVADRQRVEILKVLYRGARIIILDEPTAVLAPSEAEALFEVLRGMKAEGYTFLFISHKLGEVRAVADTVTVIRRGKTVATVDPKTVTNAQLAELIVGSIPDLSRPDASREPGRPVLRLAGVSVAGEGNRSELAEVDLTIREGEILGVAGVEGNGQTALAEVVLGMRQPSAGTLELRGRAGEALSLAGLSVLRRREAGVGYVAEDRHRHSLLLEQSLWRNRVLGFQSRLARGQWLAIGDAKAQAETIRKSFDVRAPGVGTPIGALSGGNQQKFIMGRELSDDPVLLVAAQPTRGVDVGAQSLLWGKIREAQEAGLAVLLISADLDELLALSDRIVVLHCGRIVAEADPRTVTAGELGEAMTGAAE